MELKLSRELADKRLFPAIDVNSSGTRREELITPPDELPVIYRLRRLLGGLEPEQAYQTLVPRLKKTPTNRDFLAAIVQQSNSSRRQRQLSRSRTPNASNRRGTQRAAAVFHNRIPPRRGT